MTNIEAEREALKPCPFCGSHSDELAMCVQNYEWFVRCYICHVETDRNNTKEAAIATWNRRTSSGYTSPDGFSISENHDGYGILFKEGEFVAVIKDLIKAASGYRVPEGFKLVPIEPTPDMVTAAQFHTEKDDEDFEAGDTKNYRARGQAMAVWHEMIAASPSPSDERGNVE